MLTNALQTVRWLLTLLGQFQLASKQRLGFLTWIGANGVLLSVCLRAGLWWTAGMYITNTLVCVWSYWRWARTG
jgi:hypothetical protein